MSREARRIKIQMIIEQGRLRGQHAATTAEYIMQFLEYQPPQQEQAKPKAKMELGTANYGQSQSSYPADTIPFGKFKGTNIIGIETKYLEWLVNQEWMREDKFADLLTNIEQELLKRDSQNEEMQELSTWGDNPDEDPVF